MRSRSQSRISSLRGVPGQTIKFAFAAFLVLALGTLAACGGSSSDDSASGDEITKIKYQLSWFVDEGMTGNAVADEKGYFEDEGLEVEIVPGGPTNDGVAPVASGQADIGQASSSPSLMLANSQGIPVQAFAAEMQEHPYAFISMPDTPLNSVEDLKGLNVGVPSTGVELVEAMLAANGMSKDDLGGITNISFDVGPLLQGKVDVWGGWLTDTAQLALLPKGYHSIRLWDVGVPLYASVDFANPKFIEEHSEELAGFLRATAKGWADVREDPEAAARLMLKKYPDLESGSGAGVQDLVKSLNVIMKYMFTESTAVDGWGAMDKDVWQKQIDLWETNGRFEKDPPTVDEVMSIKPLDESVDVRLEAAQ